MADKLQDKEVVNNWVKFGVEIVIELYFCLQFNLCLASYFC